MKKIRTPDWYLTSQGEPRGYIDPQRLDELWFHTGTDCNLACPNCLEGSAPQDDRLESLTLADIIPLVDEALKLGVKQFAFTGGEPFVNPQLIPMLQLTLNHRPSLVLTNGTAPLAQRMAELLPLREAPYPLSFRVSLDSSSPEQHDAARGPGNFARALDALGELHRSGFGVSIARRMQPREESAVVDQAFAEHFAAAGIPQNTRIVRFPDFHRPGATPQAPEISETCMTRYLDAERRAAFMCNFIKMVVKKNGRCALYACTLVDDVEGYDLGPTLHEAMQERVMLGHHRCFSCFSCGASCSES